MINWRGTTSEEPPHNSISSLCSVAAGRAGLYFEFNLSLWDYAAGALIAAEAGAVCLQPDGSPLPYTGEKSPLVAAPPQVLEAFFALAGDRT